MAVRDSVRLPGLVHRRPPSFTGCWRPSLPFLLPLWPLLPFRSSTVASPTLYDGCWLLLDPRSCFILSAHFCQSRKPPRPHLGVALGCCFPPLADLSPFGVDFVAEGSRQLYGHCLAHKRSHAIATPTISPLWLSCDLGWLIYFYISATNKTLTSHSFVLTVHQLAGLKAMLLSMDFNIPSLLVHMTSIHNPL